MVWGVPGEQIKAPYNPAPLLSLRTIPAKSGVRETWGTFEMAVQCVEQGLARGIGYEFDEQDIYGVDLDNVVDDNGIITPQARKIVERLNSYTEYSPSGRGLHIFVTAPGANITRHRRQGGFVEIYNNARYFTMTGHVFEGYSKLENRPNELQWVHDSFLLPEPNQRVLPAHPVESPQDSDYYLQRGLQKDRVFLAYWNGERRTGDESASDQALMNKIAYWCNADRPAMLAAFLQSPYYAQKDAPHQKKCQRADYLPATAQKACAMLRSTAIVDV